VVLIWLLGCAAEPPAEVSAVPGSVAFLTRASLDLRGVRPSAEDVRAVMADPAAADPLVEGYLADERLGDRVRSLFAPVSLTRADEADLADADYALPDEAAFLVAMGEEPLRILGEIAAEDLPYTELVRGGWTMADEVLATWYPVDYPEGATGWQRVAYTDSRPTAGILSASGFWWRYSTTTGNANRGRANALSNILLCQDYLARTIEVDPTLDLLDDEAVNDALQEAPGCVACHATLDPLGAYLWGFFVEFGQNVTDLAWYHPDREGLWATYGARVAPGYYGQPGENIEDLGRQIANDPRFVSCAVERTRELLLQRPATLDEMDTLTAHREVFLAGGLTMRSLIRSILQDPAYRAAAGDAAPHKLVSPDQYASQVEGITGYRLTAGGRDALDYDTFGLRTLAGGGRAIYGTGASSEATPTMSVVYQRVAQAAAATVVAADRAAPSEARLFTEINFSESPSAGRDAVVAQLQLLFLTILGQDVAADGEEVAGALLLWEELYALQGDPAEAWTGVLTAFLLHPDFLVY
jgi:hypothetical protein